jgi:hypothetical protein
VALSGAERSFIAPQACEVVTFGQGVFPFSLWVRRGENPFFVGLFITETENY